MQTSTIFTSCLRQTQQQNKLSLSTLDSPVVLQWLSLKISWVKGLEHTISKHWLHVFLAIISEGFVACKILLRCVKLLNQESYKSMRRWISFPQTKIAPSFLQFKSCFCISAEKKSVSLVQFCSVRRSVCLLLFVFFWVDMCIIVITQRHPKADSQQLVRTGVMHSAVHLENQISLRFLRFPVRGFPGLGFLMKHSEMSMISAH